MCSCMVPRVSVTLASAPARRTSAPTAPRRRTRVLALPEARWALASTVAFLLAFPLDLADVSAWLYGPLYVIAYAAGGWEPALEGLRALREKSLDVDLLVIVAACPADAGHPTLMSDFRQPWSPASPMLEVCGTGCTGIRSGVCGPCGRRTLGSTGGSSRRW